MPSLGTATKLARGLRELRDDADTPQYLGLVAAGSTNPTARVEYALRADELLSEPQVRQIMEYYLAVRMRRYGRTFQSAEVTNGADRAPGRPTGRTSASASPVGVGIGSTVEHGAPGVTLGDQGTGALLAHTRARPGFALHDPGLGAANAGVWGAGVRVSRGSSYLPRRHPVDRSRSSVPAPRRIDRSRSPNRSAGATAASAGPPHGAPMATSNRESQMTTRTPPATASGSPPIAARTRAPARMSG